jgi:hypothetical protein
VSPSPGGSGLKSETWAIHLALLSLRLHGYRIFGIGRELQGPEECVRTRRSELAGPASEERTVEF